MTPVGTPATIGTSVRADFTLLRELQRPHLVALVRVCGDYTIYGVAPDDRCRATRMTYRGLIWTSCCGALKAGWTPHAIRPSVPGHGGLAPAELRSAWCRARPRSRPVPGGRAATTTTSPGRRSSRRRSRARNDQTFTAFFF